MIPLFRYISCFFDSDNKQQQLTPTSISEDIEAVLSERKNLYLVEPTDHNCQYGPLTALEPDSRNLRVPIKQLAKKSHSSTIQPTDCTEAGPPCQKLRSIELAMPLV